MVDTAAPAHRPVPGIGSFICVAIVVTVATKLILSPEILVSRDPLATMAGSTLPNILLPLLLALFTYRDRRQTKGLAATGLAPALMLAAILATGALSASRRATGRPELAIGLATLAGVTAAVMIGLLLFQIVLRAIQREHPGLTGA